MSRHEFYQAGFNALNRKTKVRSHHSIHACPCHPAVFGLALLLATVSLDGAADEFDWQRFEVAGRPAFMILPKADKQIPAMPWVMYAPTFHQSLPNEANEGWMIRRFLDAGIAIAGVDVGESYGSPAGRATFNALYDHLTSGTPKFAPQACLLARSRGGLMLYNWAVENPAKVKCIAGIYPVCDLRSYPGLAKACGAYGMTEKELSDALSDHNPPARLASLAAAKVPIFHIHGDSDTVVPLAENSAAVAEKYKALGGKMKLEVASGQGHNMWVGFFECQKLVDFVVEHATQKSGGGPEEAR